MKKLVMKIAKYMAWIIVLSVITILFLEWFSRYTPAKNVNKNAPVSTKKTILIQAPVEKVWNVFTDVNHWADWQKEITKASMNAPFQPGSVITWQTNGFSIHSQLQTVQPYTTIGWAGEALGSFAIHVWRFEEHNGYTLVTVEESMEGWLVWLMQRYVQKNLHTATEYWLKSLKQASEK